MKKQYCKWCGQEITVTKKRKLRKFCSIICAGDYRSENLIGPLAANWKGGKRVDGAGYVRVYKPEHPRAHHKAVFKHRLVMEKHLGRYLATDEVVHHINGDRADNSIKNLKVMANSEHVAFHHENNIL